MYISFRIGIIFWLSKIDHPIPLGFLNIVLKLLVLIYNTLILASNISKLTILLIRLKVWWKSQGGPILTTQDIEIHNCECQGKVWAPPTCFTFTVPSHNVVSRKESGKILYQFWKYLQIANLRPNACSETRLKLSKETLISHSLTLNLREEALVFLILIKCRNEKRLILFM